MSRLADLNTEIAQVRKTLAEMQRRYDCAGSLNECLQVESETREARDILERNLGDLVRRRGLVSAGLPEPAPEGAPSDWQLTLSRMQGHIQRLDHLVEVQAADLANVYAAARAGNLRNMQGGLQLKFVGASELREIEGVATTIQRDRHGDIVSPAGLSWKNPVPFLAAHDHREPIGKAWLSSATSTGVRFKAKIMTIDEPGPLKSRVDTSWREIAAGLVQHVSIGFLGLESERLDGGGVRWTKAEILELSAVVIPSNPGAVIDSVKAAPA